MSDMVQIRSVKQYFNEFIVNGLKGKEKVQEIDLIDIKQKILKSFRDEVFGQLVFKLGPEVMEMTTDDLADLQGVQNILQQAFRKWRRLCMLCSEYGLGSFFQLNDLKQILEERNTVVVPQTEEDVTGKVPEDTVIVDEETMKPIEKADETPETEVSADGDNA